LIVRSWLRYLVDSTRSQADSLSAIASSLPGRSEISRIVYEITADGRKALYAWSQTPVAAPIMKDDLLVRLQAIECIDGSALRKQIESRLAAHKEQLTQYLHIKDVRYSGSIEPGDRGKQMSLELGIEYEKGWIDWCQGVLARLVQDG